jgi:hypothetical protein
VRVIVQPGDLLHDELRAELEPLADELRLRGLEVEVSDREHLGYGVTWWEVFHFVLDESSEHAIDAVVGAFLAWAGQRVKNATSKRATTAPKSAKIYGPDKRVIREVKIKPDEEPEIVVVGDSEPDE